MSHDLIRVAAIAAAVAVALAPYRATLAGWAVAAADAANKHRDGILRIAAASLLVGFGLGVVKIPAMPDQASVPTVTVETPSVEMQQTVAGIAKALASASPVDRAMWASVWEKSAAIVGASESGEVAVFTDTRALRGFTVIALDIAWRRLGDNPPGKYPALRVSVESAFRGVVGLDVVPVTPELRARYAELCHAVAWAGINGG